MKYGYARVSTTDQKLANQIELLKLAGAEKNLSRKVYRHNYRTTGVSKTVARSKNRRYFDCH